MINIRQTQRTIDFATSPFKKKAEFILVELGYPNFDLGIWLTTNKTIQKFNHEYRDKNRPTDVLSFPYHTNLKAGQKIKVTEDEDKNLGDLIISVPYVFENKKELEGDFIARMDRLLVHGICHLLGYDHIQDNDYKKMLTLENKLLSALHKEFSSHHS
jgi:probable rRNA maturation factor